MTRLIGRTAQTAMTCERDCRPVPITPSVSASGLASSLVASPLAAPVRSLAEQVALDHRLERTVLDE